jgi:hypothetical protein
MKTGNIWIMRDDLYDSTGGIWHTALDTTIIGRDTLIKNDTWRQMVGTKYFWLNKADGLWRYDADVTDAPELLLKYPAAVGDSWNFMQGASTSRVTVVSLSVAITVPAGTFDCYCYRINISATSADYEDYYVKPGLGMIKYVYYTPNSAGVNSIMLNSELMSYSLK